MKKKLIALVALLACILFFAAGIAFLKFYTPKEAETGTDADEAVPVTDISVAEVGAVAVTNSTGTYGLMIYNSYIELIPVDQGAGISVDPELCSQSELRAFVYAMCHLSAERGLGSVENPDEYGYSSPDSTVTLLMNDGSSVVLKLLNRSAVGSSVYVYNETYGVMYMIGSEYAALFRRSAADFTSHSFLPVFSVSELSGLEYIELVSSSKESFRIENRGTVFFLTEPVFQRVRTTLLYSDLLSPLSSLYGENCLAYENALEEYGFDSCDTVISLKYGGKLYSVGFVSGKDGCMMADMISGAVYSISEDAYRSFSTDWEELLGGSPYYYSFGDCTGITVSSGDNEKYYEVSGSGESISVSSDGEALPSDKIISLSGLINGTRISGTVSSQPEADPELVIVFSLVSGSREQVMFYKAGDDFCVSVNGVSNFTVPAADVRAIISEVFGNY